MKYRFAAFFCCLLFFVGINKVIAQKAPVKPGVKSLQFKIVQYQADGTVWRMGDRVINTTGNNIDLNFYFQNFNCPYNLPPKFSDPKFKSRTDTVWSEPKAEKTSYKNKRYTYTYDDTSRLVKYVYSGCMICADLPYTYQVRYDQQGRVSTITNLNQNPIHPDFKIQYDVLGNIKQIDQIQGGMLFRQIIRVK